MILDMFSVYVCRERYLCLFDNGLPPIPYDSEKTINPHLRRENRIRTIYSSLAIEHNSLSLEQVTAILDGKRILGKWKELFFWLPIEELIQSRQKEYYDALSAADAQADSAGFVELMLEIITKAKRLNAMLITSDGRCNIYHVLCELGKPFHLNLHRYSLNHSVF